jgi:hypothetical protein
MTSQSSGSPYEVLERLGRFQPSTLCFRKAGVRYCSTSGNTANISEDSVIVDTDYGNIVKVVFVKPKRVTL